MTSVIKNTYLKRDVIQMSFYINVRENRINKIKKIDNQIEKVGKSRNSNVVGCFQAIVYEQ